MKNKIYLLPTLVLLLLLPVSLFAQCSGWVQVGLPGFSTSYSYYGYTNSIAIGPANAPYVVYEDAGNSYKATVMKYNGTAWVAVGVAGFSPSTVNYTSIAMDPSGTPYVAFSDASVSSRVSVMKYNGTSWVYVGSPGFSSSYAYYTSIAVDKFGNPYVVFEDYANGYGATVMTFNGTSWVNVGPPSFSGTYAYYTAITMDTNGNPWVTYEDGSNGYRASVMMYNGIVWNYVGSPGFSSSSSYYNNIVVDKTGKPYVVYEDAGNGSKATVMSFNGTTWAAVGSAGFSPSYAYYESIALDTNGIPYVSFADGGNSYKCIIMKFNGTAWADVGTPDFTPGAAYSTSLAITKKNVPYVVYEDANQSDRASVMTDVSVNITSQPVSVSTCPGGSVAFTATAVGSIGVNYQWMVNTGTSFTKVVNTGVYSGATTSTLTITGAPHGMNGYKYVCQMNGGCTLYSDTVKLTVFTLPIVNATGSPKANICIGDSVALIATGAKNYVWSGGITNAVPFKPSSSGTYTVTGTDSNGCSNTFTMAVTVNGLPTISASANPSATVCRGNTVKLEGAGGIVYAWNNGVTNNIPFVPPTTGVYVVTGTDVNGCTNKDSLLIKVNPLPTVGATASPSATMCAGSFVKLNGSGALSYAWNKGVYNAVSFIPDSSGAYVVTGTDGNGCSNNDTIKLTVRSLPNITAVAYPSGSICKGSSVTLTASGGNTYKWSGGITNAVPFIPASSGMYVVTGTDTSGCSKNDTMNITVNSLPVINITGTTTICQGSNTTLTASGGNTYSWSSGSTNDTAMVAPTTTTSYNVKVTDTTTGCSATKSIGVIVNTSPSISISTSPTTAVCQGTMVTLTANGAQTYSWSGGITNAKAFTPATSGTYTVTGTASNGCTNTATVSITVNPAPAVTAVASPSPSVCKGSDITLSGNGAVGYTWSGGVNNAVAFMPSSSGTYTVTGTDNNGCTATASISITVNNLPFISANASPGNTVCKGSDVTLNGNGAVSYSWSGGITNASPFAPATSTTYTVVGTDANGCTNTASIAVTVNPLPTVFFASLGFPDTLCEGSGGRILNGGSPSGGFYSGTWVSGNVFSPNAAGTFSIDYTYTDSLGCSNTASHSVVVNVCTGVSEVTSSTDITVYPNPTSQTLYLQFGQIPSDPLTISVFDITGRTLSSVQKTITNTVTPFNVSNLPAGVYILKMTSDSDQHIFRFIKQ